MHHEQGPFSNDFFKERLSDTFWEIDGETMKTVADFIFWGSKITADGDCSHEIKKCLLLGRKVKSNLDSILKAETLLCQERSI